jgi:hypothetical protein
VGKWNSWSGKSHAPPSVKKHVERKKAEIKSMDFTCQTSPSCAELTAIFKVEEPRPSDCVSCFADRHPTQDVYAEKITGDLPVITVEEWSTEVQDKINDLQASLENMHKRIVEVAASKNMRERERMSKHIPRSARPNFEVGDFVLVGRTSVRANKLALEWKGPSRVVNVKSEWIYEVASLLPPHSVSTHHVSRLKFYADAAREIVDDLTAYATAHQDTFFLSKSSWNVESLMGSGKCSWNGWVLMPLKLLGNRLIRCKRISLQLWKKRWKLHESSQLLKAHLAAFPA